MMTVNMLMIILALQQLYSPITLFSVHFFAVVARLRRESALLITRFLDDVNFDTVFKNSPPEKKC